jgi:peptide chain release factor subunit 1
MVDDEQMARYEFRKLLKQLQNVKGRGTELVTVYIPPDKSIPETTAYLRNEYAQSQNIKSRVTRKNVMWAIESLLNRLKMYKRPPDNGLAMFVGHMDVGKDVAVPVSYVLEPPSPVRVSAYRCDNQFWLEPLEDLLVEHDLYGLIVIDRSEATLGWLRGKHVESISNIQSLVPSKHGRGGQSQRRFERLIEGAAHEFFKKVGNIANEEFVGVEALSGILIGGPGYTKNFFAEKDYLHHELKKKIVEILDTSYTDESGLRELLNKAQDVMSELDLMKEKGVMQEFFAEIRKPDGGLSAYGEGMVRTALEMGAVDRLLISEKYGKDRLSLTCESCGKQVERTVEEGKEESDIDFSCPECNSVMELVGRKDMIQELNDLASQFSSDVVLVSTDSEEGSILVQAFGGIAAILRYRIN